MQAQFTPRELEILIRHEVEKTGLDPKGLRIQIKRMGSAWAPVCHFTETRDWDDREKQAVAGLVAEIGRVLAPEHTLIG
jgi:hypothetical protein